MNVILYSTGCPQCTVLKEKMDGAAIAYTENNSKEEMSALGITHVPVLSVDGELMSFAQANKWVNQYLTKES